jgi:ABC-type glycerol-3-phosphate transport system substrate-binding protein
MTKSRFALLFTLFVFFLLMSVSILNAQDDTIVIRQLDHMVVQTPAFDRAIAIFEERNPTVRIEREVISNAREVLQFAFTGDNPPHLFVSNILEAPEIRALIDQNAIYSLDEFPDWEEFLATFPAPEAAVAPGQNVYDDVVVSMKFDADLFWHQYYINLDLYEQAGIVDAEGKPIIPKTWEEIVTNSYTIHEKTGKYGISYPGANPGTFGWNFWWTCQLSSIAYGPRGFGYDMRTGEFRASDNECFKTMITDLLRMRDDEILPPDLLAIDDEPNRALFAEGEVAHIVTGTWSITGWEQTHPDFNNYTSIPVPLVGRETPGNLYPQNPAGLWMSISTAAAEDPELLNAVWEWYKFMYSPEFARIWAEDADGISIFLEEDPSQYADQYNAGYFGTAAFFAPNPEPQLAMRNSDVGKLEQTLIGASEADVLVGIYSGQIEDWQAALEDLDSRYTEAFETALADAQAAGANLTKEDFIVRDYVPGEAYLQPLTPDHYPGRE